MITVIYTKPGAKPITLAIPEGKSLEAIEATILKTLWPAQERFDQADPAWDAMMKRRKK